MAVQVVMPRQGNTVESCIILKWKKNQGDTVNAGDIICEVETDKASFEVEAPESGMLIAVLHPEGADVPVLEPIAVIGKPGEKLEEPGAARGEIPAREKQTAAVTAPAEGRHDADLRIIATPLLMPRQGNTVESCVILEWKKKEGDAVKTGDIVCEVETDKAAFEVESPLDGTLLKIFYRAGDDVPVLTPIAAIGNPGDGVDFGGQAANTARTETPATTGPVSSPAETSPGAPVRVSGEAAASPRARRLARSKGIDILSIAGTGPDGRIIERDVRYVLSGREPLSPAALGLLEKSGLTPPAVGTGIGGRVLAGDLGKAPSFEKSADMVAGASAYSDFPVKGVRKIVASRMHQSLSTTAQLTMSASAEASALLSLRKNFKENGESLGLSGITINDIVLYAVSRVLPKYGDLNSHFLKDVIRKWNTINLGFAVDTPKGLLVPVIRGAERLSLKEISAESTRLIDACQKGTAKPEDISGGSFTVTNLGAMGIESFTPVLNIPEVAILGVCAVSLKPVMRKGETVFLPHLGLSLTIDHQAADGAQGAKFLKGLCDAIAQVNLLLAG